VPEDSQVSLNMHRQVDDVTRIAQNGEEEGHSQGVTVVRGETHPCGREPFNRHECGLGFGEPFSEVGGGR